MPPARQGQGTELPSAQYMYSAVATLLVKLDMAHALPTLHQCCVEQNLAAHTSLMGSLSELCQACEMVANANLYNHSQVNLKVY